MGGERSNSFEAEYSIKVCSTDAVRGIVAHLRDPS